jgi:hypothetical protein
MTEVIFTYLRGCLESPILCHAEGSVSPPDDLRYAKRVLSISVYVQNLDSIALRAYALPQGGTLR